MIRPRVAPGPHWRWPPHRPNARLNDGIVADGSPFSTKPGCTNDIEINPPLQLAAQWHTDDVLNNRALDNDIGSEGPHHNSGPTPPDSAATCPKPYHQPRPGDQRHRDSPPVVLQPRRFRRHVPPGSTDSLDCANTVVGVWLENSLDRPVVVAVYGQLT
jgi:hypothetical protein